VKLAAPTFKRFDNRKRFQSHDEEHERSKLVLMYAKLLGISNVDSKKMKYRIIEIVFVKMEHWRRSVPNNRDVDVHDNSNMLLHVNI